MVSKDLRKEIKDLEDQGFRVVVSSRNRYKVWLGEELVTVISANPSDHRAQENARSALKRRGYRPRS
ncbi:hypothetical protein ACFC60_22175 [Kitasatospora purpeofusca]|uniref:hypothetical protein n=1 Tax=Kitasatospora purpeofusca TaxID=67352 RepID=UPI0035D7DDB6